MSELVLDGHSLDLTALQSVARRETPRVSLSGDARAAMAESRAVVDSFRGSDQAVYGVTTGFGRLADVPISGSDQNTLQINLIRSHAAGWGTLLSPEETRVLLLLRANALARGVSGIRVEVVERLLEFLRRDLLPAIPETGSVGASGDLAPLAHMALPIVGEGRFHPDSRGLALSPRGPSSLRESGPADIAGWDSAAETEVAVFGIPAGPVLAREGLEPIPLQAKEGLALINGTQATTGLGALALLGAEDGLESLEVAGAMSLEVLLGTPDAFSARVHEARGQPGQISSAARLRYLLEGSAIRESHREGDPRVQDAYSLRCMPQIHGAGRSALSYVKSVLAIELNAATDNPLVFPDPDRPGTGTVISAGNFHAQVIAQALDVLALALADLAAVSERRVERLLNPDLSGLPAFLAQNPGLESGFMILQVTMVDLLAELRVLAHPTSVDSVPTSAGQEDHVSMGLAAARKVRRCVDIFRTVVAGELLIAAQGLEYRRPLTSSPPVEAAHAAIRAVAEPLDGDRSPAMDLAAVRALMDRGQLPLALSTVATPH